MLITPDDIRKHRSIAINIDDEKRVLTYIDEAERLDIMPAIGADLFKQISENPSEYAVLIEGGYYADNKKYCAGLKAALSMLAYARFIVNQPVNATAFGLKYKTTLDSANVDDKTLYRHANEARNIGEAYLQQCLQYLKSDSKCSRQTQMPQRKFKVIGE